MVTHRQGLRIVYDVSQTGTGKAGCGHLAASLIQHIAEVDCRNEYLLVPTFGNHVWDDTWDGAALPNGRPNFMVRTVAATQEANRSFWQESSSMIDRAFGSPDIIHSSNFYAPSAPFRSAFVYTLYDLSFIAFPDHTTEANRIACFDGVFRASLTADLIIAISAPSRRHFLQIFPHYPGDRIVVVSPASRYRNRPPARRPRCAKGLATEGFWLTVGTLEPRKNIESLLHACANLKRTGATSLPLVHAGGRGWMMDDFDALVESSGMSSDFRSLGYVDEEALQWLYEHCFAFVFPSHFEGFGLPVLEAMSCGAPVIASACGAVSDLTGDAAVLVAKARPDDLERAMLSLVHAPILREELRRSSGQRAKLFSWKTTATRVLECYDEVVARPRFAASHP